MKPTTRRVALAALLIAGATAAVATVRAAPPVPPVIQAALRGDAVAVDALLSKGADANVAQADGDTALMAATRLGRYDIVRNLLVHGAQRDQRDGRGRTAFDFAVDRKDDDLIALLRDAS